MPAASPLGRSPRGRDGRSLVSVLPLLLASPDMNRFLALVRNGKRRYRTPYLALIVWSLSACMAPPASGPEAGAGTKANTVRAMPSLRESDPSATVEGPMGTLDGEQLPSSGEPIRVPVGCHVLTTQPNSLVPHPNVRIYAPTYTFAVVFHPDHRYVIEMSVLGADHQGSSGAVNLQVQLQEVHPSGNLIKAHPPAEPASARAWCDAQGG